MELSLSIWVLRRVDTPIYESSLDDIDLSLRDFHFRLCVRITSYNFVTSPLRDCDSAAGEKLRDCDIYSTIVLRAPWFPRAVRQPVEAVPFPKEFYTRHSCHVPILGTFGLFIGLS